MTAQVIPIRRVDPPPVAGRVPPHDLDAEAAVLSAILLDDVALAKVLELLRPEHFYSEANARIFQAAQQLAIAATPLDLVTVASWLRRREWLERCGGAAYLAQIADATPHVGNVVEHARIVLEAWEKRQMIATCQRVAAECYGDTGPWEEYKATARPSFGRLTAPREQLIGRPIGAAVEEAREQVQASAEGRIVGVSYPWAEVRRIVGILAAGRATVLAGMSENGKTTMALQIAEHAATLDPRADPEGVGEAVYVHSAEMKRGPLLQRMACCYAGVDVLALESGLVHPDDVARVHAELDRLEQLAIIVDDEPAAAEVVSQRVRDHREEFAAGRARTERRSCPGCSGDLCLRCKGTGEIGGVLLGKRRLRLVIGDSAQQLAPKEQGRDDRARIEACAQGWKKIAEDRKVATVLLSLLSAPSEADLKASPKFPPWPTWRRLFGAPTALMGCADTVLAVHRPELAMEGKIPAKWLGTAAVCRLKSRFGGEGRRVYLGFDRGYFSDHVNGSMQQAIANREDQ